MTEPLFVVVLPSGRMAKIVEPTLESTWEVAEEAGARAGGSLNQSRLAIEIDKELVRQHLRAITRGPVPWQFALGKDGEPTPDVDFDAMAAAARDGAGGGYLPVTYKDLLSEGDLSIKSLFNKARADFQSLVVQINMLSQGLAPDPKAPPAAALLGRRVMEVAG